MNSPKKPLDAIGVLWLVASLALLGIGCALRTISHTRKGLIAGIERMWY